jgi:hypothetical protein
MLAGCDTALELFLPLQQTAADLSGNGRNATLAGSPSYAESPFGVGLALNGSSQYATCANNVVFSSDTFGAGIWVRPGGGTGTQRFFALGALGDDIAWTMERRVTGELVCTTNHTNLAGDVDVSPDVGSLPADQWSFVAISKTGTTREISINGALVDTDTLASATIYNASVALSLGVRNRATPDRYFLGRLARASYFSRYVSLDEWRSIMAGFGPFGE